MTKRALPMKTPSQASKTKISLISSEAGSLAVAATPTICTPKIWNPSSRIFSEEWEVVTEAVEGGEAAQAKTKKCTQKTLQSEWICSSERQLEGQQRYSL